MDTTDLPAESVEPGVSADLSTEAEESGSSDSAEIMEPIAERGELMYRQIAKDWLKEGRITRQAFSPFPKDQNLLSTDRSSLTTPEKAFVTYTSRGFFSCGTWAVTVGESNDAGVPCLWNPNPKDKNGQPTKNEAHSLIDYRALEGKSRIKAVSSILSVKANERECLYVNPGTSEDAQPALIPTDVSDP